MAVKPKLPSDGKPSYKGEFEGPTKGNKFAKPFEETDGGMAHMNSLHNDIGEHSGFQADSSGYLVKKGMAYGEAAKFNNLPPGMDINDQPYRDIRDMPLKKIMATSYPGDGWEPSISDVPEGYESKGSV